MNRNDNQDSRRRANDENTDKMSEAEIDANVEESFPASDPPSWTLGSNHRAGIEQEAETDELQKD